MKREIGFLEWKLGDKDVTARQVSHEYGYANTPQMLLHEASGRFKTANQEAGRLPEAYR